MKSSTSELQQTYSIGDRVSGRVQRLLPHAALVMLDDGAVEGIIRNRELSWGEEPKHSKEVLKRGKLVTVLVLKVDHDRNRLELSLRQAERDPWKDIDSRYWVGKAVRGKVVRLWRTGAFVELEPAVDAFVSLYEVCWSPPERVEDVLWVSDTVEGVITRVDRSQRRVALSLRDRQHQIRQLEKEAERRVILQQEKEKGVSLVELLDAKSREALIRLLRERQAESQRRLPMEHPGETTVSGIWRILLADDDPSFRSSLQRLLRRIGYEVEAVESAERAVELTASQDFDLVLMDLGFPGDSMAGLEGIERILSLNGSLPVVVVTGIAWLERNADALQEAKRLGARSTLLKPVLLGRLQDVMRAIADGQDAWELAQMPGAIGQGLEFVGCGLGLQATGTSVDNFIADGLRSLQKSTGAGAIVLFYMASASGQVSVRAHVGAPLRDYDATKYALQASPVHDVISDRQPLIESDTSRNPGRFRHLRLVDFRSCVGIPIESLGSPEYGLFLFHPRKNFFSSDHLKQASSVGALLGAAIARQEAERIIQRVQPFIFIGQLGSALVHEINSALSSVINNAGTLKRDNEELERDPGIAVEPWIREEISKCTASISTDAHRMANLVRLYLGLARREELGPTNVNEVVHQAMRVLEPKAAEDNVRMILGLENDMPTTMTVAARLEQVFINVMLNAIQQTHLTRGDGRLLISTSFEPDDGRLPIKIRFVDNGPGIHGQYLERIFELGFSTRPEGTGLGLFISRGLMESLGGRISVEDSVILLGTTFLVELPLVVPSVDGVKS